MKHTDFNSCVQKIKEQERRELAMAVLAYGNHFQFDENDELPCVTVLQQAFVDTIFEIEVTEITLINDHLFIRGKEIESNVEGEISAESVFPGGIAEIIDKIPETKTLNSTMNPNYCVFEDAINVQEISSQAVSRIVDCNDCDRFKAFEICQGRAEEFTEKFRDHNWRDDDYSYYDRIDSFIEEKLKGLEA